MGGVLRTVGQLAVGGLGYAIGGPLGFAVANTLFGLEFPQSNGQVQKFGDTNLQGSQIGTFIPQFYGQMGKVQGNIIDCSRDSHGNPAGILVKVENHKVGGKGGIASGGGQTQKVEVGYLTAAYMLGQGPLYVDKIVKLDGEGEAIVYDRYGSTNAKRGGTFTPEFASDGTLVSEVSNSVRMYFGTEHQHADTVLQGVHTNMPGYRGACYVVFNQYQIPTQPNFYFYVRSPLTGREEIILARFNDSGIPQTRRDLHNVWGHVNGAWVTSRTGVRALNESLASMCYTDFVTANGVISDASKAYPYVHTIDRMQMGAHVTPGQPPDAATIEMKGEEDFISDLSIPFNDFDINYDQNSAHAVRSDKEQITAQEVSLPISAQAQDLVPFAQALQDENWTQDRTFTTPVMPGNIDVSIGEVITVDDLKFPLTATPTSSSQYYVTDEEITPEGIVTLKGLPYDANNYRIINGTNYVSDTYPSISVKDIEIPHGMLIDGVPLNDDMANSTMVLVGAAAPLLDSGQQSDWNSANCVFTGGVFDNVGLSTESSIGKTTTDYSYAPEETTRFNYAKTITVIMDNGSLNTSTEDKVLNSFANVLALNNGTPGETLYIQFVTATLISTYTYQISGILTGRKGSDYITSIPAGNTVILMTDQDGVKKSTYGSASTNNANIGKSYGWQFYAKSDVFGGTLTANLRGNTRVPLSPVYERQIARNHGTDITIGWCYRTRYGQGVSWMQTSPSDPGDALLEFTATAGLGATVVHSVVVTGNTQAVITEADLTSWYGTLPANLMVNISQIGTITGAGHRRAFSTPL